MLPRAKLTPSPKTADRLLADLESYALVLAPHSPVLALGTPEFSPDEYRRLGLALAAAMGPNPDPRIPDMCQVLVGIGQHGPTVPCVFWSCEQAYVQAALHLAPTHEALCGVYIRTTRLRRLLLSQGAFVGWLPLTVDGRIPPEQQQEHSAYAAHFRAHGVHDRQSFWHCTWSPKVLAYTPPRTLPTTGRSVASLASLTAREEPESPCAGREIHAPRPVYPAGFTRALKNGETDSNTTNPGASTTTTTANAPATDLGPTLRPSNSTASFVGFGASSGVTDGGFRVGIGDIGARRNIRRLPKRNHRASAGAGASSGAGRQPSDDHCPASR